MIYSNMPASSGEMKLWAAFGAASFMEALAFYTAKDFPFEYARICHNYAMALMHFSEDGNQEFLNKAYALLEEALCIRTGEQFPNERILSLLGQLEIGWLMPEGGDLLEKVKVMEAKINELQRLATDQKHLEAAYYHHTMLQQLKNSLANA